ncbi:MAG: hypothetical protein WAR24_03755 [Candidatus Acidiferrales bacterium]
MKDKTDCLARRGLTLSSPVLRRLDQVAIFVQSSVSLEHQHLAERYVIRGIESGGAVKDLGRYVTFCGPDGKALPYLHPIDAIGVNGVHAVVVAPVLVRVELLRTRRTCQLLITRHQPGKAENGRQPALENSLLFRGVNGLLEVGPFCDESDLVGSVVPQFWSRAGEKLEIPSALMGVVAAATKGATCIGCSHAHYLVGPVSLSVGGARI